MEVTKEVVYQNRWGLEIALVILAIAIFGFVTVWRMYLTKSAEIVALKSKINIVDTINATNGKLDEMKRRESEEYVMIAKQQEKLKRTLAELDKQQKLLAKLTKEGVQKNVEKLNIIDLHREFTERNLPNTIILQ